MKTTDFLMPIKGTLLSIEQVPDEIFSERVMGDGFAIDMSGNEVISPVNGTVDSVFPGGHAVCIRGDCGADFMIHVGLETYKLEGVNKPKVKASQRVRQGDLLIKTNARRIRKATSSSITPVVFLHGETVNLLKENQLLDAGAANIISISKEDS